MGSGNAQWVKPTHLRVCRVLLHLKGAILLHLRHKMILAVI